MAQWNESVLEWQLALVSPLLFAVLVIIGILTQLGTATWRLAVMFGGAAVVLGCPLALLVFLMNRPSVALDDGNILVEPARGMGRKILPIAGTHYIAVDNEITLFLFSYLSTWSTAGAFPYRIRIRLSEDRKRLWLDELAKHGAVQISP
jgi:hypothetical protein